MFVSTEARILPSFLIIGGIKCGTSSLYRYICAHPSVLPCKEKEPGFFSQHSLAKLSRDFDGYCQLFPLVDTVGELEVNWVDLKDDESFVQSSFNKTIKSNKPYISCEATANTYFRARPGAVKTVLPHAKLIMLVREPMQRFVSHFRMYQRFQNEGRKGYDIPTLDVFIDNELALHKQKKPTRILSQGHYVSYLRKWRAVFGANNLLIIPTASLNDPNIGQKTMDKVTNFLNLETHDFSDTLEQKYNQARPFSVGSETKIMNAIEKLNRHYRSHNAALKKEFAIEF